MSREEIFMKMIVNKVKAPNIMNGVGSSEMY